MVVILTVDAIVTFIQIWFKKHAAMIRNNAVDEPLSL